MRPLPLEWQKIWNPSSPSPAVGHHTSVNHQNVCTTHVCSYEIAVNWVSVPYRTCSATARSLKSPSTGSLSGLKLELRSNLYNVTHQCSTLNLHRSTPPGERYRLLGIMVSRQNERMANLNSTDGKNAPFVKAKSSDG